MHKKEKTIIYLLSSTSFFALICLFVLIGKMNKLPQSQARSTPQVMQAATGVCRANVELVLDVSVSMENREYDGRQKMEWAKEAAQAFAGRFQEFNQNPLNNIRMGLTQFGRNGLGDATVEQTLTGNINRVIDAITPLEHLHEGASCILCGLEKGNEDVIDNSPNENRVVVLFSDGCGNYDGNRWIDIPDSRQLTTAEADYGRTHGITYYTFGYSSPGTVGDPCGPDQYDEQTLLEIAGDSSRHFFRPNVNDWNATFEDIADQICADSAANSCAITSTIVNDVANPYMVQPGSTVNIGTNFNSITPSGHPAEVRYSLIAPGIFNINSPTSYNRPSPPSATSLSNYYSNIDIQPALTSNSGDRAELRAEVIMDGITTCSTSTFLQVGFVNPWWQVDGGDVLSANGNVSSRVPLAPPGSKFMTENYFGMPIYSGNINPSSSFSTGVPGWDVDTQIHNYQTPSGRRYDYSYFWDKFHPVEPDSDIAASQISTSNLTSGVLGEVKDGYKYFKRTGNLQINNLRFDLNGATQKVILYVDGDVLISGKILLEDGKDFFMLITTGNIKIASGVGDSVYVLGTAPSGSEDIEALIISNKQMFTNNSEVVQDKQLFYRGLFIGYGNVGLQNSIVFERDLGSANSIYPAEIFRYGIDFVMNFPGSLGEKSITWKETAP